MKDITEEELTKNFALLRSETSTEYTYDLYKTIHNDEEYYTVCKFCGIISIQPLGEINPTIPLEQDFITYINDHAIIHINPLDHVPRWRD